MFTSFSTLEQLTSAINKNCTSFSEVDKSKINQDFWAIFQVYEVRNGGTYLALPNFSSEYAWKFYCYHLTTNRNISIMINNVQTYVSIDKAALKRLHEIVSKD